jgi:hypothetical protein
MPPIITGYTRTFQELFGGKISAVSFFAPWGSAKKMQNPQHLVVAVRRKPTSQSPATRHDSSAVTGWPVVGLNSLLELAI